LFHGASEARCEKPDRSGVLGDWGEGEWLATIYQYPNTSLNSQAISGPSSHRWNSCEFRYASAKSRRDRNNRTNRAAIGFFTPPAGPADKSERRKRR
jgi:hypothetical protein